MDGTSYFPSRPEMEANLAAFADRTALEVRYDCAWTATRLLDGPAGADRFEVETGRAGLRVESWWTDAAGDFAVALVVPEASGSQCHPTERNGHV